MIEAARIKRIYQHSLERVYEAFSNKEYFGQWIAPSDDINTNVLIYDFRIGGQYKLAFDIPQIGHQILSGEFIHIQPLQQICFTWGWEDQDIQVEVSSLVTADFLYHNGETELVITHEKLPSLQERKRHDLGWQHSLERLNNFLE